MKMNKLTPRNLFQIEFQKGKQKNESKSRNERGSIYKKTQSKKSSTNFDFMKGRSPGTNKNGSRPSTKRSPDPSKYPTTGLHELVSKLQESNKVVLLDSKHFKSSSGDHREYFAMSTNGKSKNIGRILLLRITSNKE